MKTKKINGKPMSHWERLAKELIVETLVRAAIDYGWSSKNPRLQSVIHKIAADRLIELANTESPELVKQKLNERNKCVEGMAKILKEMLG